MQHEPRTQTLRRLTWAHDDLVLTFLPELGGKIESIRRKAGENVLLSPPDFPPRPAAYGASFEEYDTSGWDECLPTVAACPSPHDPKILFPDHGELWSVPWSWKFEGDSLVMEADGTRLPYRFRRTHSIRGNTLRLDYVLSVRASENARPLRMLWSAHPLLAARPGGRISLPPEVEVLSVEGSNHLEEKTFRWPREGYRLVSNGRFKKLFSGPLQEGWAAYTDPSGETVRFRWDPREIPFLGLWICEGGWPTSRASKHFTLALEPCTGRHDSLFAAVQEGDCPPLRPGTSRHWTLDIALFRKEEP